uniref:mRNA (guanine-N(7))-methyltransferase n=1 Tax=Globisporangium ultimum (strain ATCC 200006 / CBS 805.95 / DAOM BR144) TaxID=431595 RepID=K3WYB2_GLOUD
MVREVADEPLPRGWEVLMSRSKNMPYYSNLQTKKVYWVDNELPRGWSHQFDASGKPYYFHIKDKAGTTSYEKPVLAAKSQAPPSPDPLPAPSYGRNDDEADERQRDRSYSRESEGNDHDGRRRYSDDHSGGLHINSNHPTPPRKKSNSLMDLLSPGPPALGTDERSPRHADISPSVRTTTSSSMDIANLVTSSSSTSGATKRSFEQISKDADPDAAADFYNNLKRNATSDRADSMLFHMRAMNNWVKSILIADFSKRDDRVLDLGCGKGGDLMKWAKRGVSKYVGVDIAQKSLEDAVDRFSNNNQHRDLDVSFVQGDLGKVSLMDDVLHCWSRETGWHDSVPNVEPAFFNIVSMQFAFHYMFGDEQRANRFFQTLHGLLCDGGVFIATTVDPNKVLMKYYQSLGPADDSSSNGDVRVVDEQQREVCTIRFDESIRHHLIGPDAAREGLFGLRYNFTLRDSDVDEGGEAVDTPEYLVPDDLLSRLVKENGFELLLKQNFHQFILKNTDKNRSLLEKMHVMNYEGSISDAEWEIAGLYQVLAFKKAY